jgi:hypothetical protein
MLLLLILKENFLFVKNFKNFIKKKKKVLNIFDIINLNIFIN